MSVLEAVPTKCVHLVWIWKGDKEHHLCHTNRTLWIPGDAVWAALHIPELHEEMFQEYLHWFAIIYINYILIYSWNLELITITISLSFWKNWERTSWLKNVIYFLIYINSQVGIQMDQGKMQAVQSCPQHNPPQRPPMFSRICTFLSSFHSQLQYYSRPSHFITKIQAQVSALEHPVLPFNSSSHASPLHPFSSILTLSWLL